MRLAVLSLLLAAPLALAAEYPLGGDELRLKNSSRKRYQFRFEATRNRAIVPAALTADPTRVGATLEVEGAGLTDGDSGPLALPAGGWRALGRPRGSTGYRFVDRRRATGVRTVLLRRGQLLVSAKGRRFPYAMTQPQGGPIDVRLSVGGDVFCARFAAFERNDGTLLKARAAPAPASCAPLPACGNGVLEGGEECDDDGRVSGDGCSATCQLESASALCAGVSTAAGTDLRSVRVASGLDRPLHVTAPPLDPRRVFVLEQGGRVRIVEDGILLAEPFLDVSALAPSPCNSGRGLLSLAFHPDYERNGLFFVYYVDASRNGVVARYRVSADPHLADPGSAQVILTIDMPDLPYDHYGGLVAFGPDGYLYLAVGDGGGDGTDPDPLEAGQDDATLLGKLLRIDVNAATYLVPPTNPFVGAGDPLDEIWAKGLRNPWRFSFDRGTGDLYVADVGETQWEEIDYRPAASIGGENYGWSVFEGNGHCLEGDPECATPGAFLMPIHEYDHTQGCAVTGGFVYRGCAMPDLHGTYFYSDYCTAFLRTFRVLGGVARDHRDRTADAAPGPGLSIDSVTSFGEDARGELYLTEPGDCPAATGEVFKIVPAS